MSSAANSGAIRSTGEKRHSSSRPVGSGKSDTSNDVFRSAREPAGVPPVPCECAPSATARLWSVGRPVGVSRAGVSRVVLVDQISRSDTYPYVDVREDDESMGHEATVSRVSEEQLFYLMSRGMAETEAMAMIVRGFVEPIARELPMEYALELNRLIELQMEGSVG